MDATEKQMVLTSKEGYTAYEPIVIDKAQRLRIWHLVDPDAVLKDGQKEPPRRVLEDYPSVQLVKQSATSYAGLNADEKEVFKMIKDEWQFKREQAKDEDEAMSQFRDFLASSIAHSIYTPFLKDKLSAYGILKRLKENFGATDAEK